MRNEIINTSNWNSEEVYIKVYENKVIITELDLTFYFKKIYNEVLSEYVYIFTESDGETVIKVFEDEQDEYYEAIYEGMIREARSPFEAMVQIIYNIY